MANLTFAYLTKLGVSQAEERKYIKKLEDLAEDAFGGCIAAVVFAVAAVRIYLNFYIYIYISSNKKKTQTWLNCHYKFISTKNYHYTHLIRRWLDISLVEFKPFKKVLT